MDRGITTGQFVDGPPPTDRLRTPGRVSEKQAACLVRAPLLLCQPRSVPVLDEQGQNGRLMICCLGVGPGDLGYLTLRGRELIETAEVVAGFKTVVDLIRPLVRKESQVVTMGYKDQTEKLEMVALLHHQGAKCVVVFMGDIHFSGFQFLERVERACGHLVETVAGISAAQILASRSRVCFDETSFITFHRRGNIAPFQEHLVHALQDGRNVIVIPRPWDFMPRTIVDFLLTRGVPATHQTEVWEHLSQNEAAWMGTLGDCPG